MAQTTSTAPVIFTAAQKAERDFVWMQSLANQNSGSPMARVTYSSDTKFGYSVARCYYDKNHMEAYWFEFEGLFYFVEGFDLETEEGLATFIAAFEAANNVTLSVLEMSL